MRSSRFSRPRLLSKIHIGGGGYVVDINLEKPIFRDLVGKIRNVCYSRKIARSRSSAPRLEVDRTRIPLGKEAWQGDKERGMGFGRFAQILRFESALTH
jgi:hypothetical protein